MSIATPPTVQPCSAKTRMALFASCSTLGRSASAIQAAKAFSSSSTSCAGSNHTAGPSPVASAISLTVPAPSAQAATVATPTVPEACRSSQPGRSPAASTTPSISTPSPAAATSCSAPGSAANSRSRKLGLRNSRASSTTSSVARSYGSRARSAGPASSATSRTISVSRRLSLTASRWSRRFCPTLPLTSSTRSTSSSNEPNWVIHLAAVFSPTPGDARQVVRRVAAQRREVRVLARGEPVPLLHLLRGVPGQLGDTLGRVEHGDCVADAAGRRPGRR